VLGTISGSGKKLLCKQEDIDAIYKKGVLKLVFKKARQSEAKKIEIKAG